jgi:hypothetical protein
VRTERGAEAFDAVFAACPPWRLKDLLVSPPTILTRGLAQASKVDAPVAIHATVPARLSHRLLMYLGPDFASYRLARDEPFRSLTNGDGDVVLHEPALYRATFETDRFTSMPAVGQVMDQSGRDGLWLVHSAFHPSGSRNSEQACELAWLACSHFDPSLPRLAALAP